MGNIRPLAYKAENAQPVWCPGCGDYGALAALYQAMAELELDPSHTVLVSGIGCSGRLPYFVKSFSFHSVHGRALPIAMGIKLANPNLTVIVVGGDGDGIGIGGGHLPHIARRNPNVTYLMLDNSIYGLTKGQSSPTTPLEQITSSTPYGVKEPPLDPVLLTLAHHASFVARGFTAHVAELAEIIRKGIEHKGFSFIHVLSPCPTFNKNVSFEYYKQLLSPIPEGHDPSDREKAILLSLHQGKMYRGIYFQQQRITQEENLRIVRQNKLNKFADDLTFETLMKHTAF
ncbi:MAG: thiamine pyrophosphate-dependent enzyme [bacterium]|nr:thiamine pyrophosphate-dependent enzyme [bacterium]